MSNNTNSTSLLSDSIDASIRLSIRVTFIIFSISLLTCLIVQIRRGKERFDSGFFHIYIILAICDTFENLESVVNFDLPVVSIEHFYEFYKANEHWLCGYIYPAGSAGLRISFIAQNFLALNRFTAVFLPIKHDRIWSKRNTNIVTAFIIILGVFFQSWTLFGDGPKYLDNNLSGCSYGNFIGTNLLVTKVSVKTIGVTAGITAIICIALAIATIFKLNLLRRNGTISQQHKREIPLLGKNKGLILIEKFSVYSVMLTSLEAILAVCYFVNDQVIITGGNIFNQIFSWTVFLYMMAPSVLLLLTSKTVRRCYLNFYMPKKWSYKWNPSKVINVTTTAI